MTSDLPAFNKAVRDADIPAVIVKPKVDKPAASGGQH
jgi:hypothetical protein